MANSAITSEKVQAGYAPRTRSRFQARIGNGAAILLLILMALVSLIPFLWMISTSLKTRAQVFDYPPVLIPQEPHWENYAEVFEEFPFARFALNTAFVTVTATFFQTLTAAMAAFAFARLHFPWRDKIFL